MFLFRISSVIALVIMMSVLKFFINDVFCFTLVFFVSLFCAVILFSFYTESFVWNFLSSLLMVVGHSILSWG